MQNRNSSLFRIVLPLLLIGVLAWYFSAGRDAKPGAQNVRNTARETFDRDSLRLEYSKHARCRMDCRQISEAEIQELRKTGRVNLAKSELDNERCPRWALEGNSADGQQLRIIFAQCASEMVVVTAIDLGEEHACACK